MDASVLNIDFAPLTEVKAKLSEKIATIEENKRLLVITLNGKPAVVVVPYDDFILWLKQEKKSNYQPRKLNLKDWEKESTHLKEVSESIKSLFDLSKLSRKGQKPYKRHALEKFKRIKN